MRVLITGANGQLGSDLVNRLSSAHELAAYDLDLDITDTAKVLETIPAFQPDVVIHAAAYTDVDGCQEFQDRAFMVNAIGAGNVAQACRKSRARMVYVSTDFVFDGTKSEPYIEFDETHPVSVYGASKLAGEQMVREALPECYIVRTAWLYGRNGNNFVKTILRLADERDELSVVNDQVGSPTYSADLAEKIADLIEEPKYGTYHVTNAGKATWFEFAQKIVELGGKDCAIKPQSSADLARPAPRPAYSVLDNMALRLRGYSPMRGWEDALADYFSGV